MTKDRVRSFWSGYADGAAAASDLMTGAFEKPLKFRATRPADAVASAWRTVGQYVAAKPVNNTVFEIDLKDIGSIRITGEELRLRPFAPRLKSCRALAATFTEKESGREFAGSVLVPMSSEPNKILVVNMKRESDGE